MTKGLNGTTNNQIKSKIDGSYFPSIDSTIDTYINSVKGKVTNSFGNKGIPLVPGFFNISFIKKPNPEFINKVKKDFKEFGLYYFTRTGFNDFFDKHLKTDKDFVKDNAAILTTYLTIRMNIEQEGVDKVIKSLDKSKTEMELYLKTTMISQNYTLDYEQTNEIYEKIDSWHKNKYLETKKEFINKNGDEMRKFISENKGIQHVHSMYSLLDGANKIEDIIDYAKEKNLTHVSISDHGTMGGALKFYQKAKAAGLTPVIGMEGYVAIEGQEKDKDLNIMHMQFLAKNEEGYKALIEMSSDGYNNFYKKPVIQAIPEKAKGNIVITSACIGGINQYVHNLDLVSYVYSIEYLKKQFGDDFYLEQQELEQSEANFDKGLKSDKGKKSLRSVEMTIKRQELVNTVNEYNFFKRDIKNTFGLDAHYNPKIGDKVYSKFLQIGRIGSGSYRDEGEVALSLPENIDEKYEKYLISAHGTCQILTKTNTELKLDGAIFPPIEGRGLEGMPEDKVVSESNRILRNMVYEKLEKHIFSLNKDLEIAKQNLANAIKSKDKYEQKLSQDIINLINKEIETYKGTVVKERLEYELSVIEKVKFPQYFIVLHDLLDNLITKNTENKHLGGYGVKWGARGSAAGSVVSYLLGITPIDPIKYGLPFERFLTDSRVSPPDIDLDMPEEMREAFWSELVKKFGAERVGFIGTYGKLKMKNSLIDSGKVAGATDAQIKNISALIRKLPKGKDFENIGTILEYDASKLSGESKQAIEQIQKLYKSDQLYKEWFDTAKVIQGTYKNFGIHACGMVISPKPLWEYLPVRRPTGNKKKGELEKYWVTQYDMEDVEHSGLIKYDFLGLDVYGIIRNTIKAIEINHGKKVDVEYLMKYPIDKRVYEQIYSKGDTWGIFQFESPGMRRLLKEMKPDTVEDLSVAVALYRPGPLESGLFQEFSINKKRATSLEKLKSEDIKKILRPTYGRISDEAMFLKITEIMNKENLNNNKFLKEIIEEYQNNVKIKENLKDGEKDPFEFATNPAYTIPALYNILKETYGVPIYQEQAMKIVVELAGYTLSESDDFRKAIAKKKPDKMLFHNKKFVEGCLANGISKEDADKMWHMLEGFGSYAFNKSHSASYAVLSYVTGWLKLNYNSEFMAAKLTSVMDVKESGKNIRWKQQDGILGAISNGVRIYPPDINKSIYDARAGGEKSIYAGVGMIKGVRKDIMRQIVAERTKNGEYKDIVDFINRTYQFYDKSTFYGLSGVGAFRMHPYRFMNNENNIEKFVNLFKLAKEYGRIDEELLLKKKQEIRDSVNQEILKFKDIPANKVQIKIDGGNKSVSLNKFLNENTKENIEKFFKEQVEKTKRVVKASELYSKISELKNNARRIASAKTKDINMMKTEIKGLISSLGLNDIFPNDSIDTLKQKVSIKKLIENVSDKYKEETKQENSSLTLLKSLVIANSQGLISKDSYREYSKILALEAYSKQKLYIDEIDSIVSLIQKVKENTYSDSKSSPFKGISLEEIAQIERKYFNSYVIMGQLNYQKSHAMIVEKNYINTIKSGGNKGKIMFTIMGKDLKTGEKIRVLIMPNSVKGKESTIKEGQIYIFDGNEMTDKDTGKLMKGNYWGTTKAVL